VPVERGEVQQILDDRMRQYDSLIRQLQGGAWHNVGDPDEPPFEQSWVNYGSIQAPLRFRRAGLDVHLEGYIKSGNALATARVFTLPDGFRPAYSNTYPVTNGSGQAATLDIDPAGSVFVGVNWTSTPFMALGHIVFTAAP
jgi:hypothetical protein